MEPKKAGRAPKNRRKMIRTLLTKIEKEFKDKTKETKATLADFIRLTQLERELEEEEQPRRSSSRGASYRRNEVSKDSLCSASIAT
jgi:hypothetical protein